MKNMIQLIRLGFPEILNHNDLSIDDKCLYWRSYTAGLKENYGATNELIYNFKKKPSSIAKNSNLKYYKERAIKQLAYEFTVAVKKTDSYENSTFVPMPPSKSKSHPDYDDRLVKLLNRVSEIKRIKLDIREIILQKSDTESSYKTNTRLSIDNLVEIYEIDRSLIIPVPKRVFIFDDILTRGSHYKAALKVLNKVWPNAEIIGLFIARSEHKGNEF